MSHYISSITTNYGDPEQVKKDVILLNDILTRQGSKLLFDVIGEQTGTASIKHSFTHQERINVMQGLLNSLRESLEERI